MNAVEIIRDADYRLDHNEITLGEYEKLIEALKDVRQVVHGHWETGSNTQCGISCSVCGMPLDDFCGSADYIDLKYEPNFCPHCGAIMDGDENERN